MSTVLSCKRIFVADFPDNFGVTNCLEIRVVLDKSFLRNAKYAEMTLRVFDREHMPRFVGLIFMFYSIPSSIDIFLFYSFHTYLDTQNSLSEAVFALHLGLACW
jgi:hypothetical protein